MTKEVETPVTASELEAAIRASIDRTRILQADFGAAQQVAQPFENVVGVANLPGLPEARAKILTLPGQIAKEEALGTELSKRLGDLRISQITSAAEDQAFWFRRFMTSLQIGNGAGFLAAVSGIVQADANVLPIIATLIWPPATYFGLGVGAAGILPLMLAARRGADGKPLLVSLARSAVLILTTFSIGFFGLGVGSVVVEIRQLSIPAIEAAKHGQRTEPPARDATVKSEAPGGTVITPHAIPQPKPQEDSQSAPPSPP